MMNSTIPVTSLQTHGMSTPFTTAQHSAEGGIFGPNLLTELKHCEARLGIEAWHWAETRWFPEIRIMVAISIAKTKHLMLAIAIS